MFLEAAQISDIEAPSDTKVSHPSLSDNNNYGDETDAVIFAQYMNLDYLIITL